MKQRLFDMLVQGLGAKPKHPVLDAPRLPFGPEPRQLRNANAQYQGRVPFVNLDGSANLPAGTGSFQQATPPLRPSGPTYFDPLNTNVKRKRGYMMMPINPDSLPKPMPYMERI